MNMGYLGMLVAGLVIGLAVGLKLAITSRKMDNDIRELLKKEMKECDGQRGEKS